MKNFCVVPWMSAHIWPDNKIFPCCLSDSEEVFGSLADGPDFMNNEKFKQFRLDMLNDKKLDICKNCHKAEEAKQLSSRQAYNKQYMHKVQDLIDSTQEDGTAETKLMYWDFRPTNLCNFACRTCGPELSSTYGQLSNRANNIQGNKVIHINSASRTNFDTLIDANINNVQEINFAGGEPLLMDEHASILQKLLDNNRNDVMLRYTTNGSKLSYKNTNFETVWPKFKKVSLIISIDEIFERAEYWRHGTKWDILDENISRIVEFGKQHKNIRVWFTPTVSVFNISRLGEIHKYFREKGWLDTSHPEIIFNLLHTQEYYCVKNTSQEFKEFASKKLDDYIQYLSASSYEFDKWQIQKVEGIKSFLLESGTDLKSEFTFNTAKLDKQRKESIFKVAPELADLLIDKNTYDK